MNRLVFPSFPKLSPLGHNRAPWMQSPPNNWQLPSKHWPWLQQHFHFHLLLQHLPHQRPTPDRILRLTTFNSILQCINRLVGRFVLSTECYRTRRLGDKNLNWPRCSARVTESLALTDGGKQTLYISDYVQFVSLWCVF